MRLREISDNQKSTFFAQVHMSRLFPTNPQQTTGSPAQAWFAWLGAETAENQIRAPPRPKSLAPHWQPRPSHWLVTGSPLPSLAVLIAQYLIPRAPPPYGVGKPSPSTPHPGFFDRTPTYLTPLSPRSPYPATSAPTSGNHVRSPRSVVLEIPRCARDHVDNISHRRQLRQCLAQ
ncbi:hypothetical protein CCUS01_08284 [Colletotrichum cuscutae]|uniref:Uncharacterized protein n=1 Tax=Colletotrichum cuscutae TaxID=1209917 RepID=A0AAI9UX07_9PEZI|nr:hypothetical protein CCUS01_08284 [Colletotrichum cuscutae]